MEIVRYRLAPGCVNQAQVTSNKLNTPVNMEMERHGVERKDMEEAHKTEADWRNMEKN